MPMSTMLLPPAIKTTMSTAEVSLLLFAASSLKNVEEAIQDGCRFPAERSNYIVALGEAPGFTTLGSLLDDASDIAPRIQPEPKGGDPCHIMFSSGTTGDPKGIVVAQSTRAMYGFGMARDFRISHSSVILHSGSLVFNGY